jgi:hypothetical protein
MKMSSILIRILSGVIFTLSLSSHGIANDSAAERIPAGLKFKTMRDISIEKEELYISKKKIEVSYIFRNNSDKDIVTEVAFPIPNYEYVEMNVTGNPWFEDFTVIVDGEKIKYEIVARALLKGKDFTDKLKMKGITIHDFNATNTEKPKRRLSSNAEHNAFIGPQKASIVKMLGDDKDEFIKLGLIENDGQPNWVVSKSYVWTQNFPKNSAIRIKHIYTPCYGSDQHFFDYNETLESFIKENCIDTDSAVRLKKNFTEKNWLLRETVSYILQTANNWKKPIKEFRLHIGGEKADIMGICFDKKVSPVSPDKYEAVLTDYVPSNDLKVYWIHKKTLK